MHIPEAILDPRVCAATALMGAAGLGIGIRKLERRLGERTTVQMGSMAAFVFAAQMVNFPVGPGVSGHLLGGVLSAVMLGPWAGAVVIGAVLIVQCFLFGDGGLTALGANFLNMGLIGSVVGYAIYAPIRRRLGGPRGVLFGGMIAAWFSVLLAAGAFSIELALSGSPADFFRVLSWMALVHAVIGVGEALITGLVIRFILLSRPDLIHDPAADSDSGFTGRAWFQYPAAGLAVSLAVAVFLAPFASEHPDGLEFVLGDKLNVAPREAAFSFPAPLPDYQFPAKPPGLDSLHLATAVVGVLGTLAVFGLSWGLARAFAHGASSGSPIGVGPHEVAVDAA
jgi:cobalt/nickel transport system permease protein